MKFEMVLVAIIAVVTAGPLMAQEKETDETAELAKKLANPVASLAITEAEGSCVVLDTVSSVIPIGLALSAVKAIATGKHLSVGSIGAECEGLDAATGKRLFAAVDARVGRTYTGKFDKFNEWHTAEDAFDFWAKQLRDRLSEASGKAAR